MKLSSLGPYTASPAHDIESELEAKNIRRQKSGTGPVDTDLSESPTKDATHEEAKAGLARLADFLAHQKKAQNKRVSKTVRSKLLAYENLDEFEQALAAKGQSYDSAA